MKARNELRTSEFESPKPEWEVIGARLASIRGSMSQPEMADLLGVSKTTYGRLERGVREVGIDVIRRLQALGWNPSWLVTGEGERRYADAGASTADGGESQLLSEEHLSIAIELAEEALAGKWLPNALYARLVRLLYEGVMRGLPMAEVHNFARDVADGLSTGGRNGGKQGLGGPGKGGSLSGEED